MNNLTYIVKQEFDVVTNLLGLLEYYTNNFKILSTDDILNLIDLYTEDISTRVEICYPNVRFNRDVNYLSSCIEMTMQQLEEERRRDNKYYHIFFEILEYNGDLITILNEIARISPFAFHYYKIKNGEVMTYYDPDELLVVIYCDLLGSIYMHLRDKLKLIIMSIIGGLKFNLNGVIVSKTNSMLNYPNELILVYKTP